MNTNKQYGPSCDFCDKPAIWNIQEMWHKYSIDDKGEYHEQDEWEGNENNHYCQEHYEIETGGIN